MDRTPNFARRWDAGDLPARAGLERARANWGRIVMDILLINPPWLTKDGNIWHGVRSTSPPLGLLYVASYAQEKGFEVRVLDVDAEKLDFPMIEECIRSDQPRFIGITAVTAQITTAHRIAELAKTVHPNGKVVIGGVHGTAMPEEVLSDPNVDYVVRGEGERPFGALVKGRPVESIHGLSYRRSNPLQPIVNNPEETPITDLDSLPNYNTLSGYANV